MKKTILITAICILAGTAAGLVIAGCGGDDNDVQGVVVWGSVEVPANSAASRNAELDGTTAGMSSWTSETLTVYRIDDTGTQTGSNIMTARTDTSGDFYIQLPVGVTPSSDLVISAGSGAHQTRAILAYSNTDINPISELVASEVIADTNPLSYFTNAEIQEIYSMVSSDAEAVNISASTSTAAAVATLNTGTLATNLDSIVDAKNASGYQTATSTSRIGDGL